MGDYEITLYSAPGAILSPTVTAVYVPDGITWHDLDQRFRLHGLVVGGSLGSLAGKVFRIGHVGSQADLDLVNRAVDEIEGVVNTI